MNANEPPPVSNSETNSLPLSAATIAVGFLCWAAVSLGFAGLRVLMRERPEFVGQPLGGAKAELVQESPRIVARKVSDDVSAIRQIQPEMSDVRFNMVGRRDYRGLRTTMEMSGECRARYVVTNSFDEPIFVLFRCPHPRAEGESGSTLLASGLRLQASVDGTQENIKGAWVWSGTLESHRETSIEVSFQAASLKAATYRAGEQTGSPIRQLRVTFARQDLDSMRFQTGDGARPSSDQTVVWERRDFLAPDFFSASIVETRSLYTSLLQLLEIGPLVCLLFLLAVGAVILTRQPLSTLQTLTIAAAYALYFPLILYLSVRFSFVVALLIAVVVPGALLVNYARWLLGIRLGLIGGPVFLALYWVFPTLAAFAGWNRGMVLLCLGVVTLWVLINLQNQALRRKAARALIIVLLAIPYGADGAEVQVLLPGELTSKLVETKREPVPALLSIAPVRYRVQHGSNDLQVEAEAPLRVLRLGDGVPLFCGPVHLAKVDIESAETNLAAVVTISNRLALFAERVGAGTIHLSYRVPIEHREGKQRAQVPLLGSAPGTVLFGSPRSDVQFLSANLWSQKVADDLTIYEVGVAGHETLVVEWQEGRAGAPSGKSSVSGKDFYGIGITRAQNLTVVNSDGSCTHFAEIELPGPQVPEFRLKLPPKARLISVSVNGSELSAPDLDGQLCLIKLPVRDAQQTAHRLSFRIAYPSMRLGFTGTMELTLPEVFQTTGTMEWAVALPNGFLTQILASGLEIQKSPPNLDSFGDYGRILKSHAHTCLAGELTPPGVLGLSLKYRQTIPGMYEP